MTLLAVGQYLDLSLWQVALAAMLILANGLISVALSLGLERRLLIASVRTIVQLAAIGYVLQWIFAVDRWYFVLLPVVVMTLIAGISAVRRTKTRYRGVWTHSIVAVTASSWIVTLFALTAIVRPERWYQAQYAIPLLGMILGNTLTGVSLGLDRFGEELRSKRGQVEMLLTLGATRFEAARGPIQESVRTGMIPIINSMLVVGLVSLPGMMTGQLLAGADPLGAVKYQIVIMFLIAAATALGTVIAVLAGYRQLFNHRHQFLYGRLKKADVD